MFFLPLNLIQIQGYSEIHAGLSMLPIIILIASISPFMGKFADRRGVRIPLIIGPIITSAGFFIFSTFGITSGSEAYWETFFLSFLFLGVGMGITVAPLTTAVMGAVSEDNTGIASGINNTVARAAGVLAIALMGALALLSFKESIKKEINVMDISIVMKNEIMLESSKFTAAEAPSSLSDENKVIVKKLLNDSFIEAFNKVAYVASILTFLGGLMAFIFIKQKKPTKEKL
ncbi:MAG: MFS transporter [Bacteroidales bacterium]|nr:MFS transporter [Bacteroidales bacterium]